MCEATRSDGRKPCIAPSSTLPARWYLQWPIPWQPFPQPHLPLGPSDVWGARRGEGRCHPHQTSVIIKALVRSSQTPVGPHGPRRMQKTVLRNVAPLKCKTTPKHHHHCAPPDHPLFPSAWSGQGRWWGLWAARVLSHACGCSHMSIQINCAIFVPTAAGCHFSFPVRRAWHPDMSLPSPVLSAPRARKY